MSNIIAIVPHYKKDIGNVNLVYTPDDVTEDARSLRYIINHMAKRELLDLPSLRKFLKEIFRRFSSMSLILPKSAKKA